MHGSSYTYWAFSVMVIDSSWNPWKNHLLPDEYAVQLSQLRHLVLTKPWPAQIKNNHSKLCIMVAHAEHGKQCFSICSTCLRKISAELSSTINPLFNRNCHGRPRRNAILERIASLLKEAHRPHKMSFLKDFF